MLRVMDADMHAIHEAIGVGRLSNCSQARLASPPGYRRANVMRCHQAIEQHSCTAGHCRHQSLVAFALVLQRGAEDVTYVYLVKAIDLCWKSLNLQLLPAGKHCCINLGCLWSSWQLLLLHGEEMHHHNLNAYVMCGIKVSIPVPMQCESF